MLRLRLQSIALACWRRRSFSAPAPATQPSGPLRRPPLSIRVRGRTPNRNATLAQADSAWQAGAYPVATEMYEGILARDPSSHIAMFRLATLRSWDNRFDEAITLFGVTWRSSPTTVVDVWPWRASSRGAVITRVPSRFTIRSLPASPTTARRCSAALKRSRGQIDSTTAFCVQEVDGRDIPPTATPGIRITRGRWRGTDSSATPKLVRGAFRPAAPAPPRGWLASSVGAGTCSAARRPGAGC